MALKTSENSPIRIDFLPAHRTRLPGRIGLTIAPGKHIDGVYGNWSRDLETDLRRIRHHYGMEVIVCLLEEHEFELLGISDYNEVAQHMELELIRLPIPDGGAPEQPQQVHELVGGILRSAEDGRSVLLHCRGGLGRAGTVAACCLVSLGIAPNEAIEIVRKARPHAIENRTQERFIHAYAQARYPSPLRRNDRAPSFDRFLGSLIGGAIGDALGYPVEFIGPGASILARYGESAPANLAYANSRGGIVSDDTQMTLFVAEGVIRAQQRYRDRGPCHVPAVIERALLRWHDTQGGPPSEREIQTGWLRTEDALYANRAPGNTCMSSLARLKARPWRAQKPNDSKGCGVVMRSAPIGLAARSREVAFEVACASGCQTHGHPLGYLPGGYVAALVHDVARGIPLPQALDQVDGILALEAQRGESPFEGSEHDASHRQGARDLLRWIERARATARAWPCKPPAESIEALGQGWVGEEALAIAIACALRIHEEGPGSLPQVLWDGVAHKGDSDSTGAIAGNIAGAMLGLDFFPPRWIDQVELRDIIARMAGDLYASAVLDRDLDTDCYPPN